MPHCQYCKQGSYNKTDADFIGKSLFTFFVAEEKKQLQALLAEECRTAFLQMETTLLSAENQSIPVLLRITSHSEPLNTKQPSNAATPSQRYVFCLDIARKQSNLKIDDIYRSIVFQLTHAVYGTKNIDELLQTLHTLLQEHFPVDYCSVLLVNEEQNLELLYPKADSPSLQEVTDKLALRVIQESRQIHLTKVDSSLYAQNSPAAWLGTPLSIQGRTIGVLIVQNHETTQAFSCYMRELLGSLAEHIATAINRKKNEAHLMQLALHDPLTGLANRSLLYDRIYQALDRGRRDPSLQSALFLLDLDRFKEVNDTHGHLVGDIVLKSIASRLSKLLRTVDTVSRIGGDEFVILLEGIDGNEELPTIAQRILEAVKEPIDMQKYKFLCPQLSG